MNTNDIRINLPASKSLSNRWMMINHLTGSRFRISKLSTSGDTRLLRQLLSQLSLNGGISDLSDFERAGFAHGNYTMPVLWRAF